MISCPNCDEPAAVRTRVCPACGYRFFEDRRPGRGLVALVAVAALVAAAVLLISGGEEAPPTDVEAGRAPDPPRVVAELISNHPLSRRGAERWLTARFTLGDDETAAALCSAREPRPAHAIRHCRIRYPSGATRPVVVLLDARGRELLSVH
jgi:hypothetical protein